MIRNEKIWAKGGDQLFRLSDSAYEMLVHIVHQEKITEDEQLYVRLSMGAGWSGSKLALSLEEKPLQKDEIIEWKELFILIHEQDRPHFEQMTLDITTEPSGYKTIHLIKNK